MGNVTGQSLTVASLVAPTAATSPFDNSLVTGYGNVKWNLSTNQPGSFTDVKMANLEAYVLSMLTSGGNGYFSGSLGLKTTAPTHTLTLGSTGTGIALYNTADQVTNFERVRMIWSGNYYNIVTGKGGSASARGIRIGVNASTDNLPGNTGVNYFEVGGSNFIFYIRNSLSTSLGFGITSESTGGSTLSSGVFTCASIYPYIVHTSTAGRTMLDLNPTITTEGSGAKNFILCRKASGATLFGVDSNGGLISSRVVVPSGTTTPVTITSGDTNKVYTNEGATAKIVHNLPTAVAGLTYTFIVQDADGMDVVANTGDTIRRNTNVTAAGGTVTSTAIGSVLVLVAINDTEWIATTEIGTRA